MVNAEKTATVAELAENFRTSGAAVLTEYRGLTVKQLTTLRNDIREHATYSVVKNTLTMLAAKEAGVTAFDGQFQGPSAIAFVTGDPVEAAKALRDFAKANPLLVIKGGVLDGKPLTPEEITKLADLESREVLLAKLAGALNASLSKAVYLFAAPLSQGARLFDALRAKVEAEGPVAPQDAAPADASQDALVADPSNTADPTDTPQDEAPAPADPQDAVAEAAPHNVAEGGDS